MYDLLEASGIDVPRHVYLSRDGYVSTGMGAGNGSTDTEVAEFDDHIEIHGVSIHKPFVEKPVCDNRERYIEISMKTHSQFLRRWMLRITTLRFTTRLRLAVGARSSFVKSGTALPSFIPKSTKSGAMEVTFTKSLWKHRAQM